MKDQELQSKKKVYGSLTETNFLVKVLVVYAELLCDHYLEDDEHMVMLFTMFQCMLARIEGEIQENIDILDHELMAANRERRKD